MSAHISLLCFYYRLIHESGMRWFRRVILATIGLSVSLWLTSLLLIVFKGLYVVTHSIAVLKSLRLITTNIRLAPAYWTLPSHHNRLPERAALLTACFAKIGMDMLITTLPIPIIMRMKMDSRKRRGVAILLGLGYVVAAAGGWRSYFSYRAVSDPFWDVTWWQYPAFFAATVEIDLAIVSSGRDDFCYPKVGAQVTNA